jgi:hypothetical protein
MPRQGGMKCKNARMNEAFTRKEASEKGLPLAEITLVTIIYTSFLGDWVFRYHDLCEFTVKYCTTVNYGTSLRALNLF